MKPLVDIQIPITIKPKGRPRKAKQGHFYSPTSGHEEDVALLMRSLCKEVVDELCRVEIDISKDWCRVVIFDLQEHKKTFNADIDNLGKTVLDSLEKAGILKNDRYVRELEIREVPSDVK